MYVARSGNAEALCEVAKACQAACDPKTVSGLMHVPNCTLLERVEGASWDNIVGESILGSGVIKASLS